jgi:hypothetical protein
MSSRLPTLKRTKSLISSAILISVDFITGLILELFSGQVEDIVHSLFQAVGKIVAIDVAQIVDGLRQEGDKFSSL